MFRVTGLVLGPSLSILLAGGASTLLDVGQADVGVEVVLRPRSRYPTAQVGPPSSRGRSAEILGISRRIASIPTREVTSWPLLADQAVLTRKRVPGWVSVPFELGDIGDARSKVVGMELRDER